MSRAPVSIRLAVAAMAAAALLIAIFPAVVGWRVFAFPAGNMERTLPRGSYVASGPGDVRRSSIIEYSHPLIPGGQPTRFLKRAVAVGGDRISCCQDGAVVLNGHPLSEPYVFENDREQFGPVTVPPHRLFLMGDHRAQSSDSRQGATSAGDDGTVPDKEVIGVVHGPYSRLRAHLEPLRRSLPLVLAVGLVTGVGSEVIRRLRARRLPAGSVGGA